MALTPRSGSSATTSPPNDIPNDIPNTQTDVVNDMPFIHDTNLEKIAIDTSAYPNATNQLIGFIKGKRIPVTYYRLMRSGNLNIRSQVADYATMRNAANTEYQKITNLEITLPKGLDFESDPAHASVGVQGKAMFYPNMNPSVGDVFTFGLGDGRVGIFQISSVEQTGWRSKTIFMTSFVLQSFASPEDIEALESSVGDRRVFSKENYLGGTAALLSEVTYLDLQKARAMRSTLSKMYHQQFYDPDICSYSVPGAIYDPWAVKFMANKMSMDDVHIRPKVLTGVDPKAYKQTLWARLEDRYNTTLINVCPYSYLRPYKKTRMSVFVTELVGYFLVTPTFGIFNTDASSSDSQASLPLTKYIFTDNFYNGTIAQMTPDEKWVYTAVTTRTMDDLGSFITTGLETVFNKPLEDQYHLIPLYIHLIDIALQNNFREIDAPSMNYASTGS